MGCTQSQTKASQKITKEIQKDKKKYNEEVRVLLLGPGESGKSTIFKQMKVIQDGGGYSEEDRKRFRVVVFSNIITQMKVLISSSEKLEIPIKNDTNKEYAREIENLAENDGEAWSSELAEKIKQLWADEGIQEVYQQRHKFQLNDSANYFFSSIDRIAQADYIPNLDDVLRARVRTTGIDETSFQIQDFRFRMMDVGGQRCERRKWIHCFEGNSVTAVIFCVGLSEYDQTLREETSQNRMKESLTLFEEICNSSWFRSTPIMLFLNKNDLFEKKLKQVDLSVCFPSYTGILAFYSLQAD
eukprot:TRINITY_DN2102_c0_g1_i7.p1 TRINITY_DN2102_c0_g1~~TRINITY_DN2102_c0_g1_i7.p1  ORF type:complete len:300 (-),score=39.76 TRINITY_DN2102_c0_g1_i7:255-1154(-)